MQEFGDRLRASRIKNADKRDFIPDGALDAAITDLDVKLCVKELQIPSYYQSESIAMIQNGGRKVFAILATLNRGQGCGELIVNFFGIDGLVKNSDIDSRLPFEVIDLEPIIGQEIAPEFYERQWEFISPFFREDRSHRILHEDTIMPFIDKGRKKLADGGFGVVYRETLSTEHHGLVNRYGSDGKVGGKLLPLSTQRMLIPDCHRSELFGKRLRLLTPASARQFQILNSEWKNKFCYCCGNCNILILFAYLLHIL